MVEDFEQLVKTIRLVGPFPPYMLERIRNSQNLLNQENCALHQQFGGLDEQLKGQPPDFVSVIKMCLEPDPRSRAGADAILRHDLFLKADRQFVTEILAKIKQSNAAENKASAAAFQQFIRKRNLYHKAAAEMLNNMEVLPAASLSRFRQVG